jgi:hypothetical protein
MKEFTFADQKRFSLVPIYIESFVTNQADFESKKVQWRVDRELQTFEAWEAKKDMIDRIACSRQGVMATMNIQQDFTCDKCRGTRDEVCEVCTNWKRAIATSSGNLLKKAVETLAIYVAKHDQQAAGKDAIATMTEAVGKSSCVILLCNKEYKQSPACRAEAEFAARLGKPLIAVMTEDWQPDGWLKNSIKDANQIQLFEHDQLDAAFTAISRALGPSPKQSLIKNSSRVATWRSSQRTSFRSDLSGELATADVDARAGGSAAATKFRRAGSAVLRSSRHRDRPRTKITNSASLDELGRVSSFATEPVKSTSPALHRVNSVAAQSVQSSPARLRWAKPPSPLASPSTASSSASPPPVDLRPAEDIHGSGQVAAAEDPRHRAAGSAAAVPRMRSTEHPMETSSSSSSSGRGGRAPPHTTVPLDDESTALFGQTPSRFAEGVSMLSIGDVSVLSRSMQAEKEAAVLAAKSEARATSLESEYRMREQHRAETHALNLREYTLSTSSALRYAPSQRSY